MRKELFLAPFTLGVALSVPGLAWAEADCGNAPVKTAEAVYAYTDYLASQNPDSLSEADQIAYWANLYNALTVNLILENYPVKSIRKIKAGAFSTGPWKIRLRFWRKDRRLWL